MSSSPPIYTVPPPPILPPHCIQALAVLLVPQMRQKTLESQQHECKLYSRARKIIFDRKGLGLIIHIFSISISFRF